MSPGEKGRNQAFNLLNLNVLRSSSNLQKICSQTAFHAYLDDISAQREATANLRADLSLSGEHILLEDLLSKVTHKYPHMSLKLTSTLSQQTLQQDPFLRWKQSRSLDVSLERYSDNASPEVAVSPTFKPGAFTNTTAVYPTPKCHP